MTYLPLYKLDHWNEAKLPSPFPQNIKVLIVGEQIASNILRRILVNSGAKDVAVASFFDMIPQYCEKRDAQLSGEDDLHQFVLNRAIDLVIADKVLCPLVPDTCAFVPLHHAALSGNYFKSAASDNFLNELWQEQLLQQANSCGERKKYETDCDLW